MHKVFILIQIRKSRKNLGTDTSRKFFMKIINCGKKQIRKDFYYFYTFLYLLLLFNMLKNFSGGNKIGIGKLHTNSVELSNIIINKPK